MSDFDAIKSDAKTRMDKTLETLKADFSGLRAGRAHASLLNHQRSRCADIVGQRLGSQYGQGG